MVKFTRRTRRRRNTRRRRPIRKRRFTKRSFRRRRGRRNPLRRTTMRYLGKLWPDSTMMKFYYNNYQTLTTAAGSPDWLVYRGNNAYDPLYSVGTGGSCTGYDVYSSPYVKCTVFASKCYCMMVDNGSTQPMRISIIPTRADAKTWTNSILNNITEIRFARQSKIMVASGSNPYHVRSVKNYMTTNVMWDTSKSEVSDGVGTYGYDVASASGPSNSWYWHITVHEPWDNSNLAINMYVRIVYYCKFTRSESDDPVA